MTSRLSATARREQLLAVALDVFARAGYHETSMNDIAEAAGVTKPVLYQHFESKRDLYQALLDEVGARMLHAIAAGTAEATDGRSRTEFGFRAYFRWVAEDHGSFRLLYGGASRRDQEFSRAVRRVTNAMVQAIAPLIAADIDDEHRLTLAHAPGRAGRGGEPPPRRAGRGLRSGRDRPAGQRPRLGGPPQRPPLSSVTTAAVRSGRQATGASASRSASSRPCLNSFCA